MKSWTVRTCIILLAAGLAVLSNSCMPFDPLAAAGVGDLKIYWSSANTINRANLDGTGQELVVTETGTSTITGIAVDHYNDKIYYSESMMSTALFSVNLDGTGRMQIADGNYTKIALDLEAEKLYVVANMAIVECNLDGTGLRTIHAPASPILDIALDRANNRLYWVQSGEVYRSPIGSTLSPQQITFTAGMVQYMALDVLGGNLYWSSGGGITKTSLDGGSGTMIGGWAMAANNLCVDPFEGKVYWSVGGAPDSVRYMDVISGTSSVILSSLGGVGEVYLDLWP